MTGGSGKGGASPLCSPGSDVDLVGDGERIIDLDPEVPDGAFHLNSITGRSIRTHAS